MSARPPSQSDQRGNAPGGPGLDARWTSSAKAGVGTAIGARSMVWYTISHGIVNEVYYPRIDRANTRDMGLIVTAEPDFFSEEKRHTTSTVEMIAPGVPGFRITNTCTQKRYRISKTLITDPERNVLLHDVGFEPLQGGLADYRMFVLLAPHIGNQGAGNDAWAGDYKGLQVLYARRSDCALALSSSVGFAATSCGYVGVNDGWQQLHRNRRLTECYSAARNGNVALTAEIDLSSCGGRFVLALAFGDDPDDAANAARAALLRRFETIRDSFVAGWADFHSASRGLTHETEGSTDCRFDTAVLQTHEDKVRRGAFIASLSIPWGGARGDHELGGYHVVWPRDLVQCAGGLLAGGHTDAAQHALHYLMTTQDADGHWPQNMWLDGRAFWSGTQLDETAFPILLADHLRRHRALDGLDAWPTVRRAAAYLVCNGPVTPEDRWEEDGGYSTFTLAVEIAALLAAADFADAAGEREVGRYLRETADVWNDSIERWTYVKDTVLGAAAGVGGYYVRIAPANVGREKATDMIIVRNQPAEKSQTKYSGMVSPDALALVRFGLRDARDPRIADTVRAIDHLLRTDTPNGPVWHRYNNDGYGEHEDGSPFDGTGIGRGWPLLTGERAHFELAAGNRDTAAALLDAMRRQSGQGGLLPEQIWDAEDIPERHLFKGCPTGSAMPLAWAHAEYVKLARSLQDGAIFDMPPQAKKRYAGSTRECRLATWRFNNKLRQMRMGKRLRVETRAPTIVHWTSDGWATTHDTNARDTGLGMWIADLSTEKSAPGSAVQFTFCWTADNRWEGTDFSVRITAGS
jgi:glucoamylase